jgi:hypothetical protein
MIKRYQDFLTEKLNESKDLDFMEKFDHLTSLLKNEYYSFTRIATNNRINIELGPFIEESGLTWGEIEKNKKIIFDNIDKYNCINGGVDWLLYRLDEKYILGGFTSDLKDDLDELTVKYNYGYHLNTYGESYLLQCFESMNEYFDTVIKNVIYMIYQSTNFMNYFDIQYDEIKDVQEGVMIESYRDWYLDFNQFYDNMMGHFKPKVDSYRGTDHVDKVFNIVKDSIVDFFKVEIEENIVEVEEENDYIKISYFFH